MAMTFGVVCGLILLVTAWIEYWQCRNLEEQPLSLEYKNYNRTAEATAATPSSRTDIKMSGACAEPMSVRDDFQNRY
ncbi:hypothetical protein N7470_009877 [Penicillium chermesinum]|nr:hypothetical protein N7470_009877 [Penicillium chermesinum]